MAQKRKRNIAAHEPEQPLAGVADAVQDSEMMLQVWEETRRRKAEALQELQEAGMTVLGAEAPRAKRTRRSPPRK